MYPIDKVLSKLSDDILSVLRQELESLKPITAVNVLRNDISSLSDQISKLGVDNKKLRAENGALNARLEKLVTPTIHIKTVDFATGDILTLPPVLRVGNTNFTYSLVGPEGTLANLLAATYLTKSANTTSSLPIIDRCDVDKLCQKGTVGQQIFATAAAQPGPKLPINDWRELALFWSILIAVIIYIIVLLCMYFKKTAESQLRGQEKPSTKNAAIAGWWRYRELEREEKALAAAARQKVMGLKSNGRDAGLDAIRGLATL